MSEQPTADELNSEQHYEETAYEVTVRATYLVEAPSEQTAIESIVRDLEAEDGTSDVQVLGVDTP